MVAALWAFAQAVEQTIREGETWQSAPNGSGVEMSAAKHRCLGEATERISAGYGFQLLSIQ
jgi:ribosomal protein S12 methylthiotransferase accessory factor YcaO